MPPTQIEAYDKDGRHVGSAEYEPKYQYPWTVKHNGVCIALRDIDDCKFWLKAAGAVEFRESNKRG